ncbi:MAG: helix-turn-helix domain-containing protein [Betaproteobacteria bacterium]|nr:helix-turn-helix domain-containing protein [Betaproteobacteria bacterium]
MKHSLPQPPIVEPLVDARHAARALNLPRYYFTKPRSRETKKIPFYRIGRTIRFRMSELEAWSAHHRMQHDDGEGA